MMKATLVIQGLSVQDVGYRLFLLQNASLLRGFDARNVEKDLVLFVEGEDAVVKQFLAFVTRERPRSAEVSSVKAEGYAGKVAGIHDFREQFSVELLAKIAVTGVFGGR
jgi:acylphosphatase